jgi:hypothetical protein
VTAEEGDVGAAVLAVVLASGGDGIDAAEHSVHDVRPAHLVDRRVDPVARGIADGLRDLGGVHEHLGGNAPDVEAGAAERRMLLEQRDFQVGEAIVGNGIS